MAQDRRSETNREPQGFSSTLGVLWRTFVKDLFDTYHPERHYMRGPGPKWHAKHAYATVTSNRA